MDEQACVLLANQLIFQTYLPIPRVQSTLEIGSTLFVHLLNAVSDVQPNDIFQYPQTVEEDIQNLQTVLDVLSNDVLEIPLPHITAEAIIEDKDPVQIYCLLEIFYQYTTLLSPKELEQEISTESSEGSPKKIQEEMELQRIMDDARKIEQRKLKSALKINLQDLSDECSQLSLLSKTEERRKTTFNYLHCREEKENQKSVKLSTKPCLLSVLHSCPLTKRGKEKLKCLPKPKICPRETEYKFSDERFSSSNTDDSNLVEQSLSSSDCNGQPKKLQVKFRFQSTTNIGPPNTAPKRQQDSSKRSSRTADHKLTNNYQPYRKICKEKPNHMKPTDEKNWQKGLELCASTYKFKVPKYCTSEYHRLAKADALAKYSSHLLGQDRTEGDKVKDLPEILRKQTEIYKICEKQAAALQRKVKFGLLNTVEPR